MCRWFGVSNAVLPLRKLSDESCCQLGAIGSQIRRLTDVIFQIETAATVPRAVREVSSIGPTAVLPATGS